MTGHYGIFSRLDGSFELWVKAMSAKAKTTKKMDNVQLHFKCSNFCKDHRDKIEVPDPLVLEDLISDNLNNRRKYARLIKQYRDIFFPIFRKARPSFFTVLGLLWDLNSP